MQSNEMPFVKLLNTLIYCMRWCAIIRRNFSATIFVFGFGIVDSETAHKRKKKKKKKETPNCAYSLELTFEKAWIAYTLAFLWQWCAIGAAHNRCQINYFNLHRLQPWLHALVFKLNLYSLFFVCFFSLDFNFLSGCFALHSQNWLLLCCSAENKVVTSCISGTLCSIFHGFFLLILLVD